MGIAALSVCPWRHFRNHFSLDVFYGRRKRTCKRVTGNSRWVTEPLTKNSPRGRTRNRFFVWITLNSEREATTAVGVRGFILPAPRKPDSNDKIESSGANTLRRPRFLKWQIQKHSWRVAFKNNAIELKFLKKNFLVKSCFRIHFSVLSQEWSKTTSNEPFCLNSSVCSHPPTPHRWCCVNTKDFPAPEPPS